MTDTPLTSEAKIADLVRAGELSPADARALKSALPGRTRRRRWRLFVDPWPRLSERAQLVLAFVTALASVALAILETCASTARSTFTCRLARWPGRPPSLIKARPGS